MVGVDFVGIVGVDFAGTLGVDFETDGRGFVCGAGSGSGKGRAFVGFEGSAVAGEGGSEKRDFAHST